MKDKIKILMVDDDTDALESYKDYLEEVGFIVDAVSTVDDAITALNKSKYNVSIIDMDFPQESEGGIRIVDHIKKNNINTKPVIFTGKGSSKNLNKIQEDVFAYERKDEDLIDKLLIIIRNAVEHEELKNRWNESANSQKTPVYQSVHTFEKCYNIPTRNLCYRIKKKLPSYHKEAHDLLSAIDDSIDLWANQFSMELSDARINYNLENYSGESNDAVQYFEDRIDAFQWNDFKQDLENFIEHFFLLNINDLFDHYTNKPFKNDIGLPEIYQGELKSWDDFIDFKFEGILNNKIDKNNEIEIMGIRPFFRATLINMLSNAIEAINFFEIFNNPGKQKSITVSCKQEDLTTRIIIESSGIPMDDNMKLKYNKIIFELAKKGLLKQNEKKLEDDIHDKRFTTKPGIGSGIALIQAAHYFSRIYRTDNKTKEMIRGEMKVEAEKDDTEKIDTESNNKTKFTITLPFGKSTLDEFNLKRELYYTDSANKTYFRWRQSSDENDNSDKYLEYLLKINPDNTIKDDLSKVNNIQESISSSQINKNDVLVIEDSRPDRFRMRMLFDDMYIRHYRFAWDATKKQVLSVDSIVDLIEYTNPRIIVLDLAWTPFDEFQLNQLMFQKYEAIKQEIKRSKKQKLKSFELLERLNINEKNIIGGVEKIIIMSQFVQPVADGLKQYINQTFQYLNKQHKLSPLLNKWRDEKKFIRYIY